MKQIIKKKFSSFSKGWPVRMIQPDLGCRLGVWKWPAGQGPGSGCYVSLCPVQGGDVSHPVVGAQDPLGVKLELEPSHGLGGDLGDPARTRRRRVPPSWYSAGSTRSRTHAPWSSCWLHRGLFCPVWWWCKIPS